MQGVLSLVKQDGDVGGFQCIPELFYDFDNWVKTQPADRDPMHPDTTGLTITNIEMEAGRPDDLQHAARPWRAAEPLATTGCAWRSTSPCIPANEDNEVERAERIRLWRELDHPQRDAFPGDPREWEKKNAETAKLHRARREAARPQALALSSDPP